MRQWRHWDITLPAIRNGVSYLKVATHYILYESVVCEYVIAVVWIIVIIIMCVSFEIQGDIHTDHSQRRCKTPRRGNNQRLIETVISLTISLSIIVHSLSLSSSRHRALRTNGAMVMVPAGVIYYSFFISPFVVRHILHNYFFCSRRNQCIERSTTAIGLCDHSHSRHHCKYMQFTEIPGYNKNGL